MNPDETNETANKLIADVNVAIDKSVDENLATLLRKLPKLYKQERADRVAFEARLMARWREGFDYFEAILDLAMQVGRTRVEIARLTAKSKHSPTHEVLIANHGRACLIAGEVRALLAAGYPSGAHARWRSLHELAVVSYFVKERGDGVAQRYIDHDFVERHRAACAYQEHVHQLGYEPYSEQELIAFEQNANKVIQKYGKAFAKPWGWAADELRPKPVNFSEIESAAGLSHMRPFYRMASADSVHTTFKGSTWNMGLIDRPHPQVLTGASNYGFTDPAHGALISLHQCTALLIPEFDQKYFENWFRIMVTVKLMERLLEPAGDAFLKVQCQIESEEAGSI
jgi:hypothetical protein